MPGWRVTLALVAAAALVRLQLAVGTFTIHQDGPYYLEEARIVHERGLVEGWRAIGPRKLVAAAIAPLAYDRFASEQWALALSIACGSLAVLPILALASTALGRATAVATGALYAIHPTLVDCQSEVLSEGISHLLLAASLAAFSRWVVRARLRALGASALCAVAAALCRPDGLLVAGLLPAAALLVVPFDRSRWRSRLAGTVIVAAAGGALLYGAAALSAPPGRSPGDLARGVLGTYWKGVERAQLEDQPQGQRHREWAERHGRTLGSALYLGNAFARGLPWALILPILVGLAPGRARWLALAALVFLIPIAWRAFAEFYRTDTRYFSLAYLALLPVAAEGMVRLTAWLRARGGPWPAHGAWIALALLLLSPSLLERRYDHVSERWAWESLRDRRGQELYTLGGVYRRAEHYAGIRSANPYMQIPPSLRPTFESWARDGRLDALLILECQEDDPWLQDIRRATLEAWGPGYEVRRFPDPRRPGIHTATLYLRPRRP